MTHRDKVVAKRVPLESATCAAVPTLGWVKIKDLIAYTMAWYFEGEVTAAMDTLLAVAVHNSLIGS